MASELNSVLLGELDTHGDKLLTWAFPSADAELQSVVLGRSNLSGAASYSFSRFKSQWIYTRTETANLPSEALPRIQSFSITVTSDLFNPEKMAPLLALLAARYIASGDPIKMLEAYLSVTTTGSVDDWSAAAFSDKKALLAGGSLREVVTTFGIESCLIWNVLALKKRMAVYSPDLSRLQRFIRVLPKLVWHRQDWGILRPYVRLEEAELTDLTKAGVYCAGFTDPAVKAREGLYYLLVDLGERKLKVPSHAKGTMALCSLHKGVAETMVNGADGDTEQGLIKVIVLKNKELVDKLKTLCPEDGGKLSAAALQSRGLQGNVERFLFNLALAEKLA